MRGRRAAGREPGRRWRGAGRGRGKPTAPPLRRGRGPAGRAPSGTKARTPRGYRWREQGREVRCGAMPPGSGPGAPSAVERGGPVGGSRGPRRCGQAPAGPGPGGGGPAGRVPGPDRNRQQKSSAARCGAEAAVEGRGPPLPSPCRAKPAPAGGALGSARHCTGSAGAGPPSAAGRTRPPAGSRQPWQTVGARGRTRSPSAPSRQVPTPAAGGGPTGRGAAPAAEGGGPTRAPEREAGGPHRTWRPAARRDRGERRSRAAGPSPRAREREREPPAGRRERGPRRPAARGLRRRGPDGRGAAEQSGGPPPRRGGRRVPAPQGATWLILPVVICLSQRLSHACLSKSFPKRNCGWLIKSVMVPWSASPYMDNCGNSRANTCQQAPTLREACFY